MQVDGALQGGGSTRPRRSRLNVLLATLAILVIAATVALLVWAAPLATSGVGEEEADASSAIIHDDPWNLPSSNACSAVLHDDADSVHPLVKCRDDAGNVHRVRAH